MRILVLMHEDLIPPEKIESRDQWYSADWKTEFDVVSTLKKSGHEVLPLGLGDDLSVLRRTLHEFKPKIVFNLLEEFAGQAIFDQNIVSYLELLGIKYTGCNPRGLMLARDKGLSKKILKYHRIPTPDFFVFRRTGRMSLPRKARYPLFVKSLNEEASLGITQDSIVYDEESLRNRIQYYHESLGADVIAEEYVEGREFYVGMLGNERMKVLPTWELFFDRVSDRTPKVATRKVKWDVKYREKYGIRSGPAEGLGQADSKKIEAICRRTFKALSLNGLARLDLRMNENGEVFVIEANPNPDIGIGEDFAASAEKAGLKYPQLLDRICRLGLAWSPF